MSQNPKLKVSLIILVACVVLVVGIKLLREASQKSLKSQLSAARIKGEANAPIKIVEFIDLQCPACANGVKYLRQFNTDHPGKISVELKHFPLNMHRHGFLSSLLVECAASQNKFWPTVDALVDSQKQWSELVDAKPFFDSMVKELKLNQAQLDVCVQGKDASEFIAKNKKEGELLGVKSTPTYFINGVIVVGTKSLETELNKLLGSVSQ